MATRGSTFAFRQVLLMPNDPPVQKVEYLLLQWPPSGTSFMQYASLRGGYFM